MRTATADFGKPLEYPEDSERLMEQAGFDIIKHNRMNVRTSQDTAVDEDDPQNQLARWYRHTMFHPAFKTIKGMSMALFTRQLGWPPQEVVALCSDVNRVLNQLRSPWFHKL